MLCPIKHTPMLALELEGVEIDYCTHCGGIWLDAGELALLLGDDAAAQALLESLQPQPKHGRRLRCPVCGKKMNPVAAGEVTIDRCPHGHGIWFDRGELPAIIRHGSLNPEHRVARFLDDMFMEG